MSQQQEGWPLGLQPLNVRAGQARYRNFSGSTSFNTSLNGSPTTSVDSSSDLDTESTGSFFHDRSTTLGSLIGIYNLASLSRQSIRSRRGRNQEVAVGQRSCRPKIWCFYLCSKDATDAESVTKDPPSLGHFLAAERRAADQHRRAEDSIIYGLDEIAMAQPEGEPNSLFVDGCIAPPQSTTESTLGTRKRHCNVLQHKNYGYAIAVLFPCICGNG